MEITSYEGWILDVTSGQVDGIVVYPHQVWFLKPPGGGELRIAEHAQATEHTRELIKGVLAKEPDRLKDEKIELTSAEAEELIQVIKSESPWAFDTLGP